MRKGEREGDAENARHENAGLENAAQTCRLLQGVENARLENVAQKYRGPIYKRSYDYVTIIFMLR